MSKHTNDAIDTVVLEMVALIAHKNDPDNFEKTKTALGDAIYDLLNIFKNSLRVTGRIE